MWQVQNNIKNILIITLKITIYLLSLTCFSMLSNMLLVGDVVPFKWLNWNSLIQNQFFVPYWQWFEEKQQQVEALDQQLRKLHSSIEALVQHRKGKRDVFRSVTWDLYCKGLLMFGRFTLCNPVFNFNFQN